MRAVAERIIPLLAWLVVRGLGVTYRYRMAGARRVLALLEDQQSVAIGVLHGRLLCSAHFFSRPGRGRWRLLISRSRDGELLHKVFTYLGFETVRGSRGRGAVSALVSLIRALRSGQGISACTSVDGSKGPIYQAKPGILTMAAKGHAWLVITVASSDRAWVVSRAWDRTRIPKPWARVSMVFSRPIRLPANLSTAAIERLQPRFQVLFDAHRQWLDARSERRRYAP